jgi:hypothetical protein
MSDSSALPARSLLVRGGDRSVLECGNEPLTTILYEHAEAELPMSRQLLSVLVQHPSDLMEFVNKR